MNDPIDWPAMGMPEGVEVKFRRGDSASWEVHIPPVWYAAMSVALDGDAALEVRIYCSMFMPRDHPTFEALKRAARAIEAGEVELEDSDHA